jgi:hypothetical protein
LLFAGEATSGGDFGLVNVSSQAICLLLVVHGSVLRDCLCSQGAYDTGLRAARDVLGALSEAAVGAELEAGGPPGQKL